MVVKVIWKNVVSYLLVSYFEGVLTAISHFHSEKTQDTFRKGLDYLN